MAPGALPPDQEKSSGHRAAEPEQMNDQGYHRVLHKIAHSIGHHLSEQSPAWLHTVLHVVLVVAPLALLTLIAIKVTRLFLSRFASTRGQIPEIAPEIRGLQSGMYAFILQHSRRDQMKLVMAGLTAMPVLYATLELPKIIINDAIDSQHFPTTYFGQSVTQTGYLFALCAIYLSLVIANTAIKFAINVYKGRVGERLLRRLRLTIYRRWREGAGSGNRAEVIPVISQEVEPVGGFAADAFALPVFQGGTFLTILVFMFVQDPVLGAAAVTLLPVQLALIPRLQRRLNTLARRRVAEVRSLGGELGNQSAFSRLDPAEIFSVGRTLKSIEIIRREIYSSKYFIKSLNNFLTALTPFFFYSIGGYLVIEGRLSMGALIAVLAAYKDFSAPLRELSRYYQASEDVRIRYTELIRFLAPSETYYQQSTGGSPETSGTVAGNGVKTATAAAGGAKIVSAKDRNMVYDAATIFSKNSSLAPENSIRTLPEKSDKGAPPALVGK
jgi:ABC-type multidrug transport system fused ATPase/permease subunit